jgi:hypothetical protein
MERRIVVYINIYIYTNDGDFGWTMLGWLLLVDHAVLTWLMDHELFYFLLQIIKNKIFLGLI